MNKNKNIVFNIKVLLYFTIIFIGIFTLLNSYSFFIMSDNQRKLTKYTLPTIYEMNELKNYTGNIEKDIRESILTRKAFILEKLQENVQQSIHDTKSLLENKDIKQLNEIKAQINDIETLANKFFNLKKEYIKLLRKRDNYLEDIYIIKQNIKKKPKQNLYNQMLFLLVSAIHGNNYKKIKSFQSEFIDLKKKTNININKYATKKLNFENMFVNQMRIIRQEYKLNKTILRFVQLESLSLKVRDITKKLLAKEQLKAKEFDAKLYELLIYLIIAFIISLFIFVLFINYVQKISNRMLELKNGMSSYVEGNKVEIEIKNNDEIGIIGKNFMHFVNKVSLREKELEKAKEKAEEATKSKSLFLANMSHEIRTPMNAIISMIYFLFQTKMTGEQKDFVTKIDNASKSLLSIINDILDFSKIEAGKIELENIHFDIQSLLTNITNIIELKAEEKGLYYNVIINTKNNIFYGDPLRIEQILLNLVNNAIKFTDKGSVEINIEEKENDIIRFSVKDTGIGLNQIQIQKLFKSFSQADESTTRKYGGSGLGLSISKELVELMEGKIGVDSKEGFGSLFYFEIKLQKGKKNLIDDIKEQKSIQELKNEIQKLQPIKILLVEDNAINREIVKRFLKFKNLSLTEAENGKIAVDIFVKDKDSYDLILMDIQMPIMDGYEATKSIKKINSKIPIIALTASATNKDIAKTKQAGMVEHLSKPIEIETLYFTLIKTLSPNKMNKSKIQEDNNINRELALYYLANDQELYNKILLDFYNKYKKIEISKLNEEDLMIYLHTLASLSLNIGAKKLQQVVVETQNNTNQHNLKALKDELQNVFFEIKNFNF